MSSTVELYREKLADARRRQESTTTASLLSLHDSKRKTPPVQCSGQWLDIVQAAVVLVRTAEKKETEFAAEKKLESEALSIEGKKISRADDENETYAVVPLQVFPNIGKNGDGNNSFFVAFLNPKQGRGWTLERENSPLVRPENRP